MNYTLMLRKEIIHCGNCLFEGAALILKATGYERAAGVMLLVLSVFFPALFIYSIPLLLIDFFLSSVKICPECKNVEVEMNPPFLFHSKVLA